MTPPPDIPSSTLHSWLEWFITPPVDLGYGDRELQQYPAAVFVLVLGLVAYLGFIPTYLSFGLYRPAVENLVVAAGFLLALGAARSGGMVLAIVYGVMAVSIHAAVNSVRLGWDAGFHYQILLGALVQGLVSPVRLSHRAFTAFAAALAYVGLALVMFDAPGSTPVEPWQVQMFSAMNILTFATVLSLIGLYYSEVVFRGRRALFDAQHALAAALGESQAIVDHMADGLLAIDRSGSVRAMNPSLSQLLEGEDIPQELTVLAREAMESGVMSRGEVALPDGRSVAIVASPVGSGEGAVVLVRDITREKEVDRMKTDFTAMVSHELRTPLTSILGFTKMIQNRLESRILPVTPLDNRRTERAVSQVRSNLDIILIEGRRLSALIGDVLDIAKMESGSMEFESLPVDVAALIHQAEAASSGLFVDRPVVLEVAISGELPLLTGDVNRLQQVLVNLVSNASKFTEQGAVRIEAEPSSEGVQLRVVDTGPGIPASEHEAIFDRFHQVGGGLGDRPKGTGLGLPICKHIVESHGGTIHCESELGKGAVMVIQLPTHPKAA